MAIKPKDMTESQEIQILPISQGEVTFALVGTSPIIFNRVSEKAKRELLLPKGRKTQADKAANLKHNPPEEFRDSVYRWKGNDHPTRLKFPCPGPKGAMMTAALDMPGIFKSVVGRLCWVVGEHCDIFGIPELKMDIVRMADANKTPDVRTRACIRQWASLITVQFVQPRLTAKSIANLLAGGGIVAGLGDNRQEKGKASFGQFRICDQSDPEYQQIVERGGRDIQDAALNKYRCYDEESEELIEWFSGEVVRLGRDKAPSKRTTEMENAA